MRRAEAYTCTPRAFARSATDGPLGGLGRTSARALWLETIADPPGANTRAISAMQRRRFSTGAGSPTRCRRTPRHRTRRPRTRTGRLRPSTSRPRTGNRRRQRVDHVLRVVDADIPERAFAQVRNGPPGTDPEIQHALPAGTNRSKKSSSHGNRPSSSVNSLTMSPLSYTRAVCGRRSTMMAKVRAVTSRRGFPVHRSARSWRARNTRRPAPGHRRAPVPWSNPAPLPTPASSARLPRGDAFGRASNRGRDRRCTPPERHRGPNRPAIGTAPLRADLAAASSSLTLEPFRRTRALARRCFPRLDAGESTPRRRSRTSRSDSSAPTSSTRTPSSRRATSVPRCDWAFLSSCTFTSSSHSRVTPSGAIGSTATTAT